MNIKKLSDLADIQTGPFGSQLHKEDYVSVGTPIVTVEHLGNRIFTEQNLPFVSEKDKIRLSKYVLHEGDIVFSRVGSVDRCSYVDMKHDGWMFSGRCLRVRANEQLEPLYLYYYFCSEDIKRFVRSIAVGATMPSINTKLLGEIEIVYPGIKEQRKIAELLGRIDDKIENNKEINENLLQQARAMFHQWIRGTSPAIYKISDVATINPETYSPKDNWSFVNYLDTSSITAGTITEVQYIIPSEEKLPSRARRILRKNDVVFSTVRPNQLHYGIISNPKPNMLGSTGFAVIRSKYAFLPNEIIYLALTEASFVEQMQQLAEQSVSTFPSIRPTDLDACVLPDPKEEDDDFIGAIKVIFNTVAVNNEENLRLTALRDTLLPRLMSGELDVS